MAILIAPAARTPALSLLHAKEPVSITCPMTPYVSDLPQSGRGREMRGYRAAALSLDRTRAFERISARGRGVSELLLPPQSLAVQATEVP
jgi:hypothetical protein